MLASIGKAGTYSLHTSKGPFEVTQEHFVVIEKLERDNAIKFKYGIAYADKEVSRELKEEAMLREFERRVQIARKEMGLKKIEKVEILYIVSEELHEAISKSIKQVKADLGASKLFRAEVASAGFVKEFDLDGEKITVGINRAIRE